MKFQVTVFYISSVLLFGFLGCAKSKPGMSLYFKHKLNMDSVIGANLNIVDLKITDDSAIVITEDKDNTTEIFLIDLKTQHLKKLKSEKLKSGCMHSWFKGKLVYVNISKPDSLYSYTVNNVKYTNTKLDALKVFPSTEIVENSNQYYFLNNLYGISIYAKTGGNVLLRNENGRLNEVNNTMSFPVNNKINLLSGGAVINNCGYLMAIDSTNKSIWKKNISVLKFKYKLQMISYPSFFLVSNGSLVQALDKKDGHVIWQKEFREKINTVFGLKDNVLISFISEDPVFETDEENPHRLTFFVAKIGDLNSGIEYNLITTGKSCMGIVDNKLLITDLNSCKFLNLNTGKVLLVEKFKKSQQSKYKFAVIKDLYSYKTYLKTYDGMLYW